MTREEFRQLFDLVHDIDKRLERVDERLGQALQVTRDHEKRLRAAEAVAIPARRRAGRPGRRPGRLRRNDHEVRDR